MKISEISPSGEGFYAFSVIVSLILDVVDLLIVYRIAKMTPTSCSNCQNVEMEIVEMKNFISRWFDVFSRRFDDQDKKLTILVDAVSAVNNEYTQNNHCHDNKMDFNDDDTNHSVVVEDEEFCTIEEDEIKNEISYYEQPSEPAEGHSPTEPTCQPLVVHGNSPGHDNGTDDPIFQGNDDQSESLSNVQPVLSAYDSVADSNLVSDHSDLKHSVQSIFDFYSPSLMASDDLTPISLVRDNNSIFSDIFHHLPPSSSPQQHSTSINANDIFNVDSQAGTSSSTSSSSLLHQKHARKRIGGLFRPPGTKFQSMYPSINNLLKRKLTPKQTDHQRTDTNNSEASGADVRPPNILRINKTNFRPNLALGDQSRPSTSSSLPHFKARSPLKVIFYQIYFWIAH